VFFKFAAKTFMLGLQLANNYLFKIVCMAAAVGVGSGLKPGKYLNGTSTFNTKTLSGINAIYTR